MSEATSGFLARDPATRAGTYLALVSPRHERQPLEQMHILLVLD
jgi:hypothetical protein